MTEAETVDTVYCCSCGLALNPKGYLYTQAGNPVCQECSDALYAVTKPTGRCTRCGKQLSMGTGVCFAPHEEMCIPCGLKHLKDLAPDVPWGVRQDWPFETKAVSAVNGKDTAQEIARYAAEGWRVVQIVPRRLCKRERPAFRWSRSPDITYVEEVEIIFSRRK